MNFSIIDSAHNIVIWRDNPNPGMIVAVGPEDVPQFQGQPINGMAARVNYDTHFVIFYFSGTSDGISLPENQELVRVERIADIISLHYDYEPPDGGGPDAEFSPMDIIQVEKSELFDWNDVIEIVVYYNESEIIRESVDFSTSYAIFLPLIQASDQSKYVF